MFIKFQREVNNEALEKLSPKDEKLGELCTEGSTAQAKLQRHEVLPDPGVTGMITQMETGVSEPGTVEVDSVGHKVVSESGTADISPQLNEVMETCISEQDRDPHPVEKDSTSHKVIPDWETTEIIPKGNEEMETSVSEQNGDQHSDPEKMTVAKNVVSPLLGGGGSLALLSAQYRDDSSGDFSER